MPNRGLCRCYTRAIRAVGTATDTPQHPNGERRRHRCTTSAAAPAWGSGEENRRIAEFSRGQPRWPVDKVDVALTGRIGNAGLYGDRSKANARRCSRAATST